jgi:hypothetical protein
MRVYQEMVSDLHEIEGWTRDAGLFLIGRYSVCHGTGAVIPVRNSGSKILVRKFWGIQGFMGQTNRVLDYITDAVGVLEVVAAPWSFACLWSPRNLSLTWIHWVCHGTECMPCDHDIW